MAKETQPAAPAGAGDPPDGPDADQASGAAKTGSAADDGVTLGDDPSPAPASGEVESKGQEAEAAETEPTEAKQAEIEPARAKAADAKRPASATGSAPRRRRGTASTSSGPRVKVTQIGSPIGRRGDQRATLVGLGLNKMHRTRVLEDTPAVRGMIERVKHLVRVESMS